MSCVNCGADSSSDEQVGRIVPVCRHRYCRACDASLTKAQQQHRGRPMHDLEVRCTAENCNSFLFANEALQKLFDTDESKLVRFAGSDDEALANVHMSSFQLPLDFATVGGKAAPVDHLMQQEPRTWPSIEHYMQSAKFDSLDQQEKIRSKKTWHEAHTQAWSTEQGLRPKWDDLRLPYLERALKAKFAPGEKGGGAFEKLMSTGDNTIVFCDTDLFWGANNMMGTWQGDNMMGQMLMRVRGELMEANK